MQFEQFKSLLLKVGGSFTYETYYKILWAFSMSGIVYSSPQKPNHNRFPEMLLFIHFFIAFFFFFDLVSVRPHLKDF